MPFLSVPSAFDLTSLLRGQNEASFARPLLWHFPNFWGGLNNPGPVEGPGMGACSVLRSGDWKLIYYHGEQSFELFDLAHDLGEKNDLAKAEP